MLKVCSNAVLFMVSVGFDVISENITAPVEPMLESAVTSVMNEAVSLEKSTVAPPMAVIVIVSTPVIPAVAGVTFADMVAVRESEPAPPAIVSALVQVLTVSTRADENESSPAVPVSVSTPIVSDQARQFQKLSII
jgi:hypothetical protein